MSKDQAFLDKLVNHLRAEQNVDKTVPPTNGHAKVPTETRSDEWVIEQCRKAQNAAKFAALYDHGDVHTYHSGDDSAADLGLLGILKFYTQDEAQLERLFSRSKLGERSKWRNRADYRNRTIGEALSRISEAYSSGRENGHRIVSSLSSPYTPGDDDYTNDSDLEVVWFSELGKPKPRQYIIEKIGVKGYPIVAYGAGGVAKSFAMLSAGIAIASEGPSDWLGLQVLEHGHVLYLDFELDVDEQHRRVRDLCAGLGIETPERLAYLSGVGITADKAFKKAQSFVREYEAVAVIVDSMGLAMAGDMERGKDVLQFHTQLINPLRRAGATPFIVDHEGKLQSGEKRKDKAPIGSAYKAWVSRNVLQFQLDEYDKEQKTLKVRVRQNKTNFEPVTTFGASFTFEEHKVSIRSYDLEDSELVEEDNIPVRDRILAALGAGPATNVDLQQLTGASVGTVRNNLSQLGREGLVEASDGRPAYYSLVSSSPPCTKGNDSDDTTVLSVERAAEALRFGNGPRKALENYRRDLQSFESVVKSVLQYWHKDMGRWADAAPNVLSALESMEAEGS